MRDEDAPIAVIGIGSVLLGDDGVGPFVVELLRAGWEFPEDVALIDAGTPGLDLVAQFQGHEVVIIVDAVAASGEPGELRLYGDADLRRMPMSPRVSPHDPAVQEALWIADLGGSAPREVLLLGIIPATTEVGTELSEPVRQAARAAAEAVVAELAGRGAFAVERSEPRAPNTWWMRSREGEAPAEPCTSTFPPRP